MAKKEKKVSIALFDKIAKEHFNNEVTIQWHDAEVNVKRSLPMREVLAFVDDVVESCFHDQYGFMPEVKNFAIRSNVLSRYANFALPDNLEHRYQMVYCTDAVDAVCEVINTTQLQEIEDAIEDKIQFNCDTRTVELQKRIEQAADAIDELRNNVESIFSGVTQDDIRTLMGAITESGLDEQKIVKAYMDQKRKEPQGNVISIPSSPESDTKDAEA